MAHELARHGATQSGQRFLDSSAPRPTRHAVLCETAGGGIGSPSPAGRDQKLSREFEGSALIGAEGAVPLSLDYLTNNRNTEPPDLKKLGRGKHCGRFSIRGYDPKTGRHIYRRVNCGSWACSYCGKRKARLAKWAIRENASKLKLHYFLTLTCDPAKIPAGEDPAKHLQEVFCKFRTSLRREFGETPVYIKVTEYTKRGLPHFHLLVDRRIEHAWIKHNWDRLGGGKIVWIERAKIRKISHYLSKYLSKELLLSAPQGLRRITTSRKVKLFSKHQSEIDWEFLRSSLWYLLHCVRERMAGSNAEGYKINAIEWDENEVMTLFAVSSSPGSPPPNEWSLPQFSVPNSRGFSETVSE